MTRVARVARPRGRVGIFQGLQSHHMCPIWSSLRPEASVDRPEDSAGGGDLVAQRWPIHSPPKTHTLHETAIYVDPPKPPLGCFSAVRTGTYGVSGKAYTIYTFHVGHFCSPMETLGLGSQKPVVGRSVDRPMVPSHEIQTCKGLARSNKGYETVNRTRHLGYRYMGESNVRVLTHLCWVSISPNCTRFLNGGESVQPLLAEGPY